MPLYESRRFAENRIEVTPAEREALVIGPDAVVQAIVAVLAGRKGPTPMRLAFDGWYNIDWTAILAAVRQAARHQGIGLVIRPIAEVFQSREAIAAYKRAFTETDDPGFGVVNTDGHIADLMDAAKLAALKAELVRASGDAVIVYGAGAAVSALADAYDAVFYFDKTRQPILWEMWGGKLIPFGWDAPKPDYGWKEYYYCDYYLLDRQKEFLLPRMDYWVEGIAFESLKLLPRAAYDGIMQTLLQYPIKELPIYQPGPWGPTATRIWAGSSTCPAWNATPGTNWPVRN